MARLNPSGELPDDITILNSHYFPESLPSVTVTHIRKSKECQERLIELLETEKHDSEYKVDKYHEPRGAHSQGKKWDAVESIENEFSNSKSAVYWSCGYPESIIKNNTTIQNNAVINLIKMFLP
jgi:hypothetical protein